MMDKATINMVVMSQKDGTIQVDSQVKGISIFLLNGLETVLAQIIKQAPEGEQENQLKLFYENTLERLKE